MTRYILILSFFVFSSGAKAQWEAPLSGAVTGFQIGGPKGLALGLMAGCIDEALVSFEWTEKHYLTAGLLGMGATQKLTMPYHLNDAVGFLTGFLFAKGQLSQWLDRMGSPVAGALAGLSYGGPYYAAVGAACGLVGLENMASGVAVSSYVIKKPGWSEAVGVSLGLLQGYAAPKTEQKSPVKLAKELYGVLSQLMPPKELDRLIEKQALVLVASQLVLANLGLELTRNYQLFQSGLERILENPTLFSNSIVPFGIFAGTYFGIESISGSVTRFLTSRFSNQLEDRFLGLYFNGEVPLKLSQDNATRTAVKNMIPNVLKVTDEGGNLLADSLKTNVDGIFHLSFLVKQNSAEFVLLIGTYQSVFTAITTWISDRESSYKPLIDNQQTKLSRLQDDMANKASIILSGNQYDSLIQKNNEFVMEKRDLEVKQQLFAGFRRVWIKSSNILDYWLKHIYVGFQIMSKKLDPSAKFMVIDAGYGVSEAVAWSSKNIEKYTHVQQAILMTEQLLGNITRADTHSHFDSSFESDDKLSLELHNVSVGIADKVLAQAGNLNLKAGIYAVTGPSGFGKSTFLKKLKGLRHSSGWSKGNVIWRGKNEPKIAFASQEDYFLPYTSLESRLGKDAGNLLTEIGFFRADWREIKDDWGVELSGGEKKKVALVDIILQRPDVVILDEVFNGLDSESVYLAQKLLKKHLSESLILVVDHEFRSHNQHGFYVNRLHFEDGGISLAQLK